MAFAPQSGFLARRADAGVSVITPRRRNAARGPEGKRKTCELRERDTDAMAFGELLREVLRTVRANALRSFLTLLGVIIGVATLVSVVAVISGLNGYVRDKVFALAPDVFVISKFGIIRSHEEFIAAMKRRAFDQRDFQRIAPLLRHARQVGAELGGPMMVKY